MSGLESSAFTATVTAFVPGGATIAGLLGAVQALQGPGEPAFKLEYDPWGRDSIGYGLEPKLERRGARIVVASAGPSNALGWSIYNPNPPGALAGWRDALSGAYNAVQEPASGTFEAADLRKMRQAIHAAGARRGDPVRLGHSAVLGNVGTGNAPRWIRVEIGEAFHGWTGALVPIKVSKLQAFGEELTARQDATPDTAEPYFWWIDLRTWEGGGAQQTWEERVRLTPVAGYGTPGGYPVTTLAAWTAGATAEAQLAREEWNARRAEQLEQQALEAQRWREWKAERAYQAQLAAQLEALERAALEAYAAGVVEPEQSATAAADFTTAALPALVAPPTPIVQAASVAEPVAVPTSAAASDVPRTAAPSPLPIALGALAALFIFR